MLQSEVYYFLREVNSGLPNNVEKFDLWSLAEKFSGSTKGALEWLGVLFQDTSEAEVSIHFLESISKTSQSTVFAANLNELKTALENLRQYSPSRHPSLFTHGLKKLYPPEVDDPKMIGGIYHYYVPAYLTQKLKEQGYPSRVASFVSFLFNYIYEITTAGFDSTDLIFNEPLKIESPWRIHLIFMGYLGAYSQRDPPALYSFEEVGAELRRNPASLIQDIADQ